MHSVFWVMHYSIMVKSTYAKDVLNITEFLITLIGDISIQISISIYSSFASVVQKSLIFGKKMMYDFNFRIIEII